MEIVSSALVLLVVGLETTSSSLSIITYALAFHKDIQDKLYEELKSIAQFDSNTKRYTFEYERLTSAPYLDAVISEVHRFMGPVDQSDRVASQDYYIEKYRLHVPKGTKINIHYTAIMHDPEYWPEPYKFDPERFMPGNKEKIVPGSYCPFGIGPRHCIGMRFALTEIKLALAKMLIEFQFEPAPGTKFPPRFPTGFKLPKPIDPRVKLISRAAI